MIGSEDGDAGAAALSEELKTNTTLTKLIVCGKKKQNKKRLNGIHQQSPFSTLIKSTGNDIEERGATSISDALKSNTTLEKLDLECEYKRNNTQMASVCNPLFSILIKSTGNGIGETGRASLSDALKSNTTLTELSL